MQRAIYEESDCGVSASFLCFRSSVLLVTWIGFGCGFGDMFLVIGFVYGFRQLQVDLCKRVFGATWLVKEWVYCRYGGTGEKFGVV